MVKLIGTVGTGMTRRGIVAFDWDEPGDVEAQVAAAIETFNRSSFGRLSRRLAEFATGILESAGLPSDPEKGYQVTSEGTWAAVDWPVVDEDTESDDETSDDPLTLSQVVEASGYAEESPQGYAANVLLYLMAAKMHLLAGNHDDAMALAFTLGELATEAKNKEEFEPDVDIGVRVRKGGRQAHVRTYGTKDEIDARYGAYVEAFDSLVARGTPKKEAYDVAAKTYGVSDRTIRRAVAEQNRKA